MSFDTYEATYREPHWLRVVTGPCKVSNKQRETALADLVEDLKKRQGAWPLRASLVGFTRCFWGTVLFRLIRTSRVTGTLDLYEMSHLSCVPRPLSKMISRKWAQIWEFRVHFFRSARQRRRVTPNLAGVRNQKFGQRGHRSHPCPNHSK